MQNTQDNTKHVGTEYQENIKADPTLFFEKTLGVTLWEKQLEIVESIRDHKRTTVRSCNSAGKTKVMGDAVLWYLFAYAPCIVVTTAPTFKQVKNQLWKNIKRSHAHAKTNLGGYVKQTELEFADDWYAIGVATKDGDAGMESMQGWHSPNILFVIDESSGVGRPVKEAIEGGMIGEGSRLVEIGNPTKPSGDFFDSFSSPLYNKIHISAFDTPNVIAGETVIHGLVTKEWIEDVKTKYGEDSDVYRVRVLGEFPKKDTDTLISFDLVESAIDAEREEYGEEEFIGLDPSRKGHDMAAFIYRKGNFAKVLETIEKTDTMVLAGKSIKYLKEFPNARLRIDIIGLGAGTFDRLREQPKFSDRVEGVNVAVAAQDKEQFLNLRAEGWQVMREWLRDAILEEHKDWYELAAPKYKLTSKGQVQLESKDDMAKRGVKSPNVGDALALTFQKPTEGGILAPMWI